MMALFILLNVGEIYLLSTLFVLFAQFLPAIGITALPWSGGDVNMLPGVLGFSPVFFIFAYVLMRIRDSAPVSKVNMLLPAVAIILILMPVTAMMINFKLFLGVGVILGLILTVASILAVFVSMLSCLIRGRREQMEQPQIEE